LISWGTISTGVALRIASNRGKFPTHANVARGCTTGAGISSRNALATTSCFVHSNFTSGRGPGFAFFTFGSVFRSYTHSAFFFEPTTRAKCTSTGVFARATQSNNTQTTTKENKCQSNHHKHEHSRQHIHSFTFLCQEHTVGTCHNSCLLWRIHQVGIQNIHCHQELLLFPLDS
jgi:hypothetical protein